MSRFQISAEEYTAIKAAEQAVKDKRTSKWLHILMMRYEGYKVDEIAKYMGHGKSVSTKYAVDIESRGWMNSYGIYTQRTTGH